MGPAQPTTGGCADACLGLDHIRYSAVTVRDHDTIQCLITTLMLHRIVTLSRTMPQFGIGHVPRSVSALVRALALALYHFGYSERGRNRGAPGLVPVLVLIPHSGRNDTQP